MQQYVKIRYSIDMEDVPKKILSLLEDMRKVTEDCTDKHEKILESTKNLSVKGSENISAILEDIEGLRHALFQIDMRMGDCSQMLRGYQRASLGPPEEEEMAFEPHEEEREPYDDRFREQIKERITNEVMSDFNQQMQDITNSWKATGHSIDEAHQQAMEQLPPNVQSMINAQNLDVGMPNMPANGSPDLSGQADVMKAMMEKMMKGEIDLPINKKK